MQGKIVVVRGFPEIGGNWNRLGLLVETKGEVIYGGNKVVIIPSLTPKEPMVWIDPEERDLNRITETSEVVDIPDEHIESLVWLEYQKKFYSKPENPFQKFWDPVAEKLQQLPQLWN